MQERNRERGTVRAEQGMRWRCKPTKEHIEERIIERASKRERDRQSSKAEKERKRREREKEAKRKSTIRG